jgi:hypothetical protein
MGDAATISLYQQEAERVRPAEEILKENAVILLKEPYFKCVAMGGYGIRVAHPTDIVWLPSDDPRIPSAWRTKSHRNEKTAEQWKQAGRRSLFLESTLDRHLDRKVSTQSRPRVDSKVDA